MSKNILIYIHNYRRVQEIATLYEILSEEFNIELLIENNLLSIKELEKRNLKFTILKCDTKFLDKLIANRLLISMKQSTIGQYIHQKIFEFKYSFLYKYISKKFENKKFNLLLVCSDRHLNLMEYALMKYSRDRNIDVLIPYLVYTTPDSYITGIKNNKNYISLENDYFYKKYVFNKFKHLSFKSYHVFQPFFYMFLYNKKLLSNNPWVLGAGLATKTLVCNEKVLKEYKANNPRGNYEIIGDLTYLKLQKSLNDKSIRSNIYSEYNLKNNKNLIYAIPPYIELDMVKKEDYIKRIELNLESLLSFKEEYNILITLHPSMNYFDYKYLENIYRIKIIKQELSYFLHISDLYITYPSSTVIWSTLLGIKTLILGDIVDINIFDDLKTPIFLTNFTSIDKDVDYILNDYQPNFKNDWEILSKEKVFHKNLERDYISLVQSLVSKT
ncbi:hypothetical protein [Aliarcobacter butzleri]|uniref:hypothetical protein n=1 Tax=Aliarcobacter butzleri TaxID=28197 RepID=UPI0021B465AD|nr:hypothetical protein [Aliarcobacter butzleri]MCT7554890.1 hypothetical protein [Aliarcobacter butzleri]